MDDHAHGDDHHAGEGHEDHRGQSEGEDVGHGDFHGANEDHRTTSPMQAFSTSQVGIGLAVLVVGLVVVFGIPLLAA
ncbi:hypothetical protein C2R22_06625 [Salinigranum rubrum]|uniref:Uncharacterized protein n=1 Tax=Salinigranum rubrum TaxID=755307 RepID=A0A2I8VHF7_9EURY|nr:hypothetical protein [Salinigranum rubrum]AUV81373.1 hypothetical protein C2R22_06625 [Salinigranum rubrum]